MCVPHPRRWSIKGTCAQLANVSCCVTGKVIFNWKRRWEKHIKVSVSEVLDPTGATCCGHVGIVAPVLYRKVCKPLAWLTVCRTRQLLLMHWKKQRWKQTKTVSRSGERYTVLKRGSHPVCTVPGVLLAIASDICCLLKTSGFSIHFWKNWKNRSHRRGERKVKGYRLLRPTETLTEIEAFRPVFERAGGVFIFTRNEAFFPHVQTEASLVLCCGVSWGWWGSFPALGSGSLWYLPLWLRQERSTSTLTKRGMFYLRPWIFSTELNWFQK